MHGLIIDTTAAFLSRRIPQGSVLLTVLLMGQDVSFRWWGVPSRSPLPSHLASLLSAVTRAAVAFAPWESLRNGIVALGLGHLLVQSGPEPCLSCTSFIHLSVLLSTTWLKGQRRLNSRAWEL